MTGGRHLQHYLLSKVIMILVCSALFSVPTFAGSMEVNRQGFISALKLRASGGKGWYRADCIYCKEKNTFAVLFTPYGSGKSRKNPHFHCYHAKCGKSGTLQFLAKEIGHPEYATGGYVAPMDINMRIEDDLSDVAIEECMPPAGYRKKTDIQYLLDRGLTVEQLERYDFGLTRIHPDFKNYVIALVKEGGRTLGYVARLMMNKEEIDRLGLLRYRNSGSDFALLVYGIDEITENTRKVITVEGIYDKHATDRKLWLDSSEEVKCVCTFGAKLSDEQAEKISNKGKNIEEVVIMYDVGTVSKSKKVSGVASSYFPRVTVAALEGGDPDEVEPNQITDALSKVRSVVEYSLHELDTDKFEL